MAKALAWDCVTDKQNFKRTYIVRYIKTILGNFFFMATRLTRKQVFSTHLTSKTNVFLSMPKNSLLNDLKLYSTEINWNNRTFHFSGVKDIKHWKKLNWKSEKDFKLWKLNSKYHSYLLLISPESKRQNEPRKNQQRVQFHFWGTLFVSYTFMGSLVTFVQKK